MQLCKPFRVLQILVWISLISSAWCTCNKTGGDSYDYDYDYGETFYENSIEFSLCCNTTMMEASWAYNMQGNAIRYVSSLEYVCSGDQQNLVLSGKSSHVASKHYAAIEGSESCTAILTYEDSSYMVHSISLACSVDLCLPNPCQPNEICHSKDGNFTCTCRDNFNSNCTACEYGYHFSKNNLECSCEDGDMRLVHGPSEKEGHVEVCINNQYGGIADSSWEKSEASVVCQQLGFGNDSVPLYYDVKTNSTVFLSQVRCSGNESSLLDCSWNGTNSYDFNNSRRVGVKCEVYSFTQEEMTSDSTTTLVETPSIINSVKSMKLVEALCGVFAMILFLVGLAGMVLVLLFYKRCCSQKNHKVEVQKCFEQELDVGFEPVDFKFNIPASTSIHSITTVVCPMEREEFTKIELETQLSPVLERYTFPNVIQRP